MCRGEQSEEEVLPSWSCADGVRAAAGMGWECLPRARWLEGVSARNEHPIPSRDEI